MMACSAFLLGALISSVGQEEITRLAAAGNDASIQSIVTYFCKVEYVMSAGVGEGRSTAEYWRDPDGWRLREMTSPAARVDLEEKAGRLRIIGGPPSELPGGRRSPGIVVKRAEGFTAITDPWQLGLFMLPVSVVHKPPLAAYSLTELVAKGKVRKADWETSEHRRLAHLSIALEGERRAYEVWVDPGYNWMTTRCVQTIADVDGSELWNVSHELTGMVEVRPSIFVPVGVRVAHRMKGKLVVESTVQFAEVQVNEPGLTPPPMPYPSKGGVVVDEIEGLVYPVDFRGRRNGPATRLGERIVAYGGPPAPTARPDWRGLVGWSLATLAPILVLAALVLRYRTRSHT